MRSPGSKCPMKLPAAWAGFSMQSMASLSLDSSKISWLGSQTYILSGGGSLDANLVTRLSWPPDVAFSASECTKCFICPRTSEEFIFK